MPEIVDAPSDRQSRRYAHTLRRGGELSGPTRAVEPPPAPPAPPAPPDDSFDAATIAKPKPARPADPASPALDTNRASAPSDSTALYRKRTNPTMATLSPDLIARAVPAAEPPAVDPLAELAELVRDGDASASDDDAPSRLPSVVLDAASRGIVVVPLALRRAPLHLVLSLVAVALVVVAIWCFHSMF
ncbi:MAG TPA: hypothetical protein VK607_26185 [Kofleriaceae bacterium]|nr:hypothetical protein [Kofleriaceae bacterium]